MPDNNVAVLEELVNLAGHLAWPVTSIFLIFLTRDLITQITAAIVNRIKDNRSGIEIGPGGIKVSAVVAGLTNTSMTLNNKIDADPNFRQQLENWLQEENPDLTVTSFLDSKNHEELREQAMTYFNL